MEKQMNKLVLISGSSRGLGAAMAKSFSEAGYSVAINYFNSEKEAKELSKILPNQSHAFKCNISNKNLASIKCFESVGFRKISFNGEYTKSLSKKFNFNSISQFVCT